MSCFDCKHFRMCYVFKTMDGLIRFDTNDPDFSKNHGKFYKTLAEVCEVYEKEKED